MTTEKVFNYDDQIERIHKICLNKLNKHFEFHRQALTIWQVARLVSTKLNKLGLDASTFFDEYPDIYFVCHTARLKNYVFSKKVWDSLDSIEKERWMIR